MIFASLLAKLGFDTTKWTQGATQAETDLKRLERTHKSTMARIRFYTSQGMSFQEAMAENDSVTAAGKNSLMKQMKKIGGMMKGSGAIVGLKIVAEEFAKLGDAAEQMGRKIREGTESAADAGYEMMRQIPIMGGLIRGIASIKEAITGENQAREKKIALMEAESKKRKELNNIVYDTVADVKKQTADMIDDRSEWDKAIADSYEKEKEAMNKAGVLAGGKKTEEEYQRWLKIFEAFAANRAAINDKYSKEERKKELEGVETAMRERRKREEEGVRETLQRRKEAIGEEIKTLTDKEGELERIIGLGSKTGFAGQTTASMRFGGTVQLQPTASNPLQKVQEAALAELRGIKNEIKTKQKEEAAVMSGL